MSAPLARDLVPLAEAIISAEKSRGDQASRFRIAMGESALAMAAREESGQVALVAAEQALIPFGEALAASIRSGSLDASSEVYTRLLAAALARTAVTRPGAV